MADMLYVNGYSVPIADMQLVRSHEEVGSQSAQSAGLITQDNRRGVKRAWACATPPMSGPDADALENFVEGNGWRISFDDGYASKNGLQPDGGYTGINQTADKRLGTRAWKTTSNAHTLAYRFPVKTRSNDYSIFGWHKVAGWNHFAIVSKQGVVVRYLNGEVDGVSSFGFCTVTSPTANAILATFTSAEYSGVAANPMYLDDLCLFPFALTAEMVAGIASMGIEADLPMSDLPNVLVTGDFVRENPGAGVVCRAFVTGVDYVWGTVSGAFAANMRVVSFRLEEV